MGSPPTGYFYACDPDTEGIAKVSAEAIAFDNSTGPVPFTLKGAVLASGVNKRSLYLGAVITGATTGNKLYLTNLSATVRLNVGK